MISVRCALAIVTIVLVGCGANEEPAAQRSSVPPAATATATPPSPCPAPPLEPGYLPAGVEMVERGPLYGRPERTRTWARDDVLVQLIEGFSGDHGDEPDLETVTVRGYEHAGLLETQTPDGKDGIVIDWVEETRCGQKQYVVVTQGLDRDESLRVANSLEGETK